MRVAIGAAVTGQAGAKPASSPGPSAHRLVSAGLGRFSGALQASLAAHGGDDGFTVGDAGDPVGVLGGPVESQRGAPVVPHQDHVALESELFPQREEVVAVLEVAVAVRAGRIELVRVTHPEHVAGDQPAEPFQVWHDVAPEVLPWAKMIGSPSPISR